uniref:Uncharacterized protein n=1 Tax=Chlamydomonas euryale TaxID=1486919 RepID=A0A7R9Z955_9CHLO|mmetsp:Transcript_9170/g.27925  ORF Transcript_9170/g.27925 Transcript_9170/m.27925 type:complete len:109 (+) Transcript_9170:363-689(+)
MGGGAAHNGGSSGGGASRATATVAASALLPLLLLCTGCSVALLSQRMAAAGIVLAEAQAPAWTKYTLNFAVSAGVETIGAARWRCNGGAARLSVRHSALLTAMGCVPD